MKIFFESSAVFAERSGIGQFTKRLIETYHKHYPDKQIRLFGFKLLHRKFTPPIPSDSSLRYSLIRWFPGKIFTGLFKKGIPLPIDLMIGASANDVIIYPNFVRWPLLYNRRSIAFVHDLSFVFYGQFSSPPNRDYMLKFVPQTIKNSNHIITISQSSKRDIQKYYSVPAEKISIVHPFIDEEVFKPRSKSDIRAIRKKLNLPDRYLLFVSSLEPRKNVVGLMRAYEKLSPKLRSEYALVLAGGRGWLNEEIHHVADGLEAEGLQIIRTGYIADEDLPALYSGATIFVFPTFYEGFGIPPLEAMACGLPVITSNNSSLPEVVGDAALLVDADNTVEIAKAMEQLLLDPTHRESLSKKGLKQAKKFNPRSSAKQLDDAMKYVL